MHLYSTLAYLCTPLHGSPPKTSLRAVTSQLCLPSHLLATVTSEFVALQVVVLSSLTQRSPYFLPYNASIIFILAPCKQSIFVVAFSQITSKT